MHARYTIHTPIKSIDIFGAACSKRCAIVGRDFSIAPGGYEFKEHPSAFGTTTTAADRTTITFIVSGGVLQDKENPLGIQYFGGSDVCVRNAITETLYGSSPLGVNSYLILAALGCYVGSDIVDDVWVEGSTRFALTRNAELYYAPIDADFVHFDIGSAPDISRLLSPQYCFTAKLRGGTYIIALGLNTTAAIPGLKEEFPELRLMYDGSAFIGAELLGLLRDRGCVFYTTPYIKNDTDQAVLTNYAVNPGKVSLAVLAQTNSTCTPLASGSATDYTNDLDPSAFRSKLVVYNCM